MSRECKCEIAFPGRQKRKRKKFSAEETFNAVRRTNPDAAGGGDAARWACLRPEYEYVLLCGSGTQGQVRHKELADFIKSDDLARFYARHLDCV